MPPSTTTTTEPALSPSPGTPGEGRGEGRTGTRTHSLSPRTRDSRSTVSPLPFAALLLTLLPLTSCDYSRYESGLPITPERLHAIEPFHPADVSTTPPATRPVATTLPTQPADQLVPPPPSEIRLTLAECRQLALENNLDLKVELFNPPIAREAVNIERARFESAFTLSSAYAVTDTPTSSELTGSSAKDFRITPGVTIPLRTGGTVNLELPFTRGETNNTFSTLNPAYTSDFAASISHPLLRGAGLAYNSLGIRIANYTYQSAQANTKLQVIGVLADVDRIYWRLYAARQLLDVRKKQYDLAVAQLDRAKRQVAAGAAAEVDIVRAESGVADSVEAIINAETAIRNSQRDLKQVINRPDLPIDSPTVVITATEPNPLRYTIDAPRVLRTATEQRMELLDAEIAIARGTAEIDRARSDLLPLVNLEYRYNINGLGPTQTDAFRTLRSARFQDHSVGLTVEIPIGNALARAELRRAYAGRLQAIATREQRTLLVQKEVLNALDNLEANWQRIIAAQRRVILAARVVDLETRQYQIGLRTSTDVLDAQARLADAQRDEIAAIAEYEIAQVDLAFSTGMTLGASSVSWREPQTGQSPATSQRSE